MSYSQNDEEEVILRIVGDAAAPRRFLDIGAHDGVTFSNTRKLAESGWGGTLVEPSPSAFVSLMQNYEGRDVALVHAAVVAVGSQRLLKFYDSRGDMVSTLSEGHRKTWEGRPGHRNVVGRPVARDVGFQPIYVSALSVADLIAQFPGPYAFLNLDVEGTNFDLFRELPMRVLGVEVACVEYQDKRKEIEQLAATQGYAVAHATRENLVLQARAL